MSNVIPIVSSSPPPLDEDTGGFDEWGDDDDFGGFMTADQTQNDNNLCHNSSITSADQINANFTNQLPQRFPDTESSKSRSGPLTLDLSLPYSCHISSENILNNKPLNSTNITESKHSDTVSGNSTGDSGLFDVSPIPISEDTKSDSSDDSPGHDTFQDTSDDIPSNNNDLKQDLDDKFANDEKFKWNHAAESSANDNLKTESPDPGNNETCQSNDEDSNIADDYCSSDLFNNSVTTGSKIEDCVKNDAVDEGILSNSCSSLNTDNSDSSHEEKQQNIETLNTKTLDDSDQVTGTHVSSENLQGLDDINVQNDKEMVSEIQTISDNNDRNVTHDQSGNSDDEFTDFSSAGLRDDASSDTVTQTKDITSLEKCLEETSYNRNEDLKFSSDHKGEFQTDDWDDRESKLKINEEFASFNTELEVENETFANFEGKEENDDFYNVPSDNEDDLTTINSADIEGYDNEMAGSVRTEKQENEEEFANFTSAKNENYDDEFTGSVQTKNKGNEEKFANFTSAKNENDDDEFTGSVQTKIKENEQEFANFTSAKNENDDDEFTNFNTANSEEDDFANFSSVQLKEATNEIISSSKEDNFAKFSDDEEEFTDFTTSKVKDQMNKVGAFNTDENGDSEDEFADFSSAQIDDDFSDFTCTNSQSIVKDEGALNSSRNSDSWATFQEPHITIPSNMASSDVSSVKINVKKLGSTITECFLESVALSEQTTDLDGVVQENKNPVWINLQNVDNIALMKWSECLSNKNLYVSLKIDTKNILLGQKKRTVPIYVDMGLLEPTKGLLTLQPEVTLVDTNKQEEVKDLPPVQFDWTSSGLTNPLEVNSKLQQLDFLTVEDSELSVRSKVFDSDLIHGHKPAMQPLQSILANLKVTKKTRLEDLSDEAGRVISHLPDMSFMKAKVLMFPLKQNTL